jgi:hypothetical protein
VIRDLGTPRLWRLECTGDIITAVDETGAVTIEIQAPGYLVDYVGTGCIVRANIAEGLLVIHEKVR